MRALTRTARLTSCVSALLASTTISAYADMSSAVRTTSQQVKGLQAPAEVIVDHWGIPHIYTANQHDAFFMQGYNAARHRLWQIDLWRKRGFGLLAKDFGPDYADQDRAARMFAASGGDDYALLAAFPADIDPAVTLSLPKAPTLACIGKLVAGSAVALTHGGKPVPLPERLGYEHRTQHPPMGDRG